jgi:hypothetical protein
MRPLALLALALPACLVTATIDAGPDADGADSGDTQDEPDDTDPEPEPFAPAEGMWSLDPGRLIEDSCGFDGQDDDPPPGTMALVTTSVGSFDLEGAGGRVAHCTLDDMAFVCASWVDDDNDLRDEGVDAIIHIGGPLLGAFTSPNDFDATLELQVSCEGDDCWRVEWSAEVDFPCETVRELIATRAG